MADLDIDKINTILSNLSKKGNTPASEQTLDEIRKLLSGDTGLGAVKDETGGVVGHLKDLKNKSSM